MIYIDGEVQGCGPSSCMCTRGDEHALASASRSISVLDTGIARTEGVAVETWPEPAQFIIHVGRRCFHVTISSHVSRSSKGEVR